MFMKHLKIFLYQAKLISRNKFSKKINVIFNSNINTMNKKILTSVMNNLIETN